MRHKMHQSHHEWRIYQATTRTLCAIRKNAHSL